MVIQLYVVASLETYNNSHISTIPTEYNQFTVIFYLLALSQYQCPGVQTYFLRPFPNAAESIQHNMRPIAYKCNM